MTDIRIQRMAQVLVRYSLGLKKGDRFAILTEPVAAPLVRELVRQAVRAGAHSETVVSLPGGQEILLKEGSDEQLSYVPATRGMIFEEYEAFLSIFSQENTKALSSVDPARMAIVQGQDYLDKMLSLDEGARRLGEFAFGNNRNVTRCTKNTLFDEKMGGTVHLALGASIPGTGV